MHETDQQTITTLEAHHDNIGVFLRAAEDWIDQYRKDEKSFRTLLAAEQRILRSMRRYFRELPERGGAWVDWQAYNARLKAAKAPLVTIEQADLDNEQEVILKLIFDDMAVSTASGAQAGQAIYNIDLGLSKASQSIIDVVHTRTAEMIKDINQTTRDRVVNSVDTSLRLNEDIREATDRLDRVLNDPVRAERVARTETVAAYNDGMNVFGVKSGAESKTWQAVPESACPICSALDGQTVGISDSYDDGIDAPPGHPNCRCGQVLNYPAAPADEDSSEE